MLTEVTLEILKYEDIKTKTLDDIPFNKEDIYTFKTDYLVGDRIKTDLTEMFDGVT